MEQKDKLATLVEQVDREAQAFTSFDNYIAAKEKSEGVSEWEKSVADAEAKSLPDSNGKAEGTAASSNPSSAEPVTPPAEPKEKTWSREAPYTNLPERTEQLSHPVAPNVTAPEAPYKPVKTIPDYATILSVTKVEWPGGESTAHVSEQQVVREPDSLNSVYLRGRDFCVTAATNDEIIAHYHFIEGELLKAKDYLRGIRSGLEERLIKENQPSKVRLLDRDSIASRNLKQAAKLKTERSTAPKNYDAEIRKAAQILLNASMAKNLDEAIATVKASRIKKGLPV